MFTMQRLSTHRKDEEMGMGLGLLLCKEFLEKNNGAIWVHNDGEEYTSIVFFIPSLKMAQE
jgi:signal transduction histidine kinase